MCFVLKFSKIFTRWINSWSDFI